MNRAPSLAAIALGLALAGCGPVNRGVATVHQPVVTRADYTLDVGVDAGGLRYGEERRLNAWFESLHLGYGDRVSVDDPAPSAGHRAAIAEAAGHYGVIVNQTPPITEGAVSLGLPPPPTPRIEMSSIARAWALVVVVPVETE